MESWAANNPFYAPHVNWAFSTEDTTRTQAAARSGVVRVASYSNVTPQNRGINENDPMNWASPVRSGTSYDKFGNVNKQVGDVQLGLVLMGGFQFPGQAFMPDRSSLGTFSANKLARWMNKQGVGGYSPEGRRYRSYRRETGWSSMLSQSFSSNKAPDGIGQSSMDSTLERYSTQETRLGTRAYFTDEEMNKDTGRFGRTWAGFKPLGSHATNPHFDSKLTQMFKTENANVGAARRAPRTVL
jgi:hypothetical protein